MSKKKAIIIGAGPAGLTAAYEFVTRSDITPIIYEMSSDTGGISKTVKYKGNRIDIGGHRFFSKSDRVMEWWQKILPFQNAPSREELKLNITYQNKTKLIDLSGEGVDPEKTEEVLLIRNRLSRIFFLRKFFDYPISLNLNTVKNLGIIRMFKIGVSYIWIKLFSIKDEKSLEDFFINRFGGELYKTFFKDYTEKVWGVPCSKIEPEWGAQRIKGLSITKAVLHSLKNLFTKDRSVSQKGTESSLIERFLYPKYGPGQMWETVEEKVKEKGGVVIHNHKVEDFVVEENKVIKVKIKNMETGEVFEESGDYIFSTMPVKDLINGFNGKAPEDVKRVAKGLLYRDFITVGVLLNKLKIKNQTKIKTYNDLIPDNWIYVQENDVHVGRIQVFNNWSPYLVGDIDNAWLGLEYFCNEGDSLWSLSDEELKELAVKELTDMDLINKEDVLDSVVIRVPKTYPAYFGTYSEFEKIRNFVDGFENLFLIGRNGMHRYNNQDHSMLSAMTAVDNILSDVRSKDNIWNVNAEEEYHETKSG